MTNNINCKILVCCHKQDIVAKGEPYFPIHVGKALSDIDLGFQGDNSGDNISIKNPCYCELTGMYWAWKNLRNVNVVGLCHYRRYFDFHGQCKRVLPCTKFATNQFGNLNLSVPDSVIEKVLNGHIVIPRPRNYRYNPMVNYCISHNSKDFDALETIVHETQDEKTIQAFEKTFYRTNNLCLCNMFVMNWNEFDSYCSWLFTIIGHLANCIDISSYDSQQKRIWGYMAERLFNVWLQMRKGKKMQFPVIWFNEQDDSISHYSPASYLYHSLVNNTWNALHNCLIDYRNHDFEK